MVMHQITIIKIMKIHNKIVTQLLLYFRVVTYSFCLLLTKINYNKSPKNVRETVTFRPMRKN